MRLLLFAVSCFVVFSSISSKPSYEFLEPRLPDESSRTKRADVNNGFEEPQLPKEFGRTRRDSSKKEDQFVEGNGVVRQTRASYELHPDNLVLKVRTPDEDEAELHLRKRDSMENVAMEMENEPAVKKSYSDHGHYVNDINSAIVSTRLARALDGHFRREYHGHFIYKRSTYKLEPTEFGHRVTRTGPGYQNDPEIITKRKSKTENVVEYCAVLDYTIFQSHMKRLGNRDAAIKEIRYVYTHFFNGIDIVYRNVREFKMSIRVAKFVVQETVSASKWLTASTIQGAGSSTFTDIRVAADRTLNVMNAAIMSPAGRKEYKCDHVAMYTKTNLELQGEDSVIGLAYIGQRAPKGQGSGVCKINHASVAEDNDFLSWLTGAHELAHNLGSDHDGEGGGADCQEDTYIMAPWAAEYTQETIKNSLRFSSCSIRQIRAYVDNLNSVGENCMKRTDNPDTAVKITKTDIGKRYTIDEICKLQGYVGRCTTRYTSVEKLAGICLALYCENKGRTCESNGQRALPGSPCGNQKSCDWAGQCVNDPNAGKITNSVATAAPIIPNNAVTVGT